MRCWDCGGYCFRLPLLELGQRGEELVLLELGEDWPACDYNVVTRNCIHFSQALVERLGCPEKVPDWVCGAAEAAASPLLLPLTGALAKSEALRLNTQPALSAQVH